MDVDVQFAPVAWATGAKVTAWFPEKGEHVQTPAVYPQEFELKMVGFFRGALRLQRRQTRQVYTPKLGPEAASVFASVGRV